MPESFKPYYNWNTFNTKADNIMKGCQLEKVLNLIITGIPSILKGGKMKSIGVVGFKPYYNWNTFNTLVPKKKDKRTYCFKPYYNWNTFNTAGWGFGKRDAKIVLNLIITGIPSILLLEDVEQNDFYSFKPYYNWNTFNT